VTRSTSANRNRFGRCHLAAGWGLLALVLTASSGCSEFLAQGRNAQGVRLYQQAQYQDALREFQEAIYKDPKNPDGYYNIAATYHRMGSAQHSKADWDQAEHFYNLCLDQNDNHVDCYRGLAVLLAEQGRNDEAFNLIERWAASKPTTADAKVELARLYEEFGDRQKSKENLIEALAIQPDHARALAALGKIREDAGETSQALANYQRSLNSDNNQPQLASRVTALRGGMPTSATTTPPSVEMGTRVVDRNSSTVR
jgi:tetratricopeptide (TPR) repeat protein